MCHRGKVYLEGCTCALKFVRGVQVIKAVMLVSGLILGSDGVHTFVVIDAVTLAQSTSATYPQDHQGIQWSKQSKLSNSKQVGIGKMVCWGSSHVSPTARLVKVRVWC